MTNISSDYKKTEEQINVYSHFAGIILSVIGLFLLVKKGLAMQSFFYIAVYTLYGISLLALFTASTMYHSAKILPKRKKYKVFDHMAIYFLIAGTYTPFTLLGLKGAWGWYIFAAAWTVGLAGMVLKLFFTGKYKLLSTISYVAMGCIIVVAVNPLLNSLSAQALGLLAWGGVFYIAGAVLYSFKRIPYNHAIFHFFVLGGALCHFGAIYLFI